MDIDTQKIVQKYYTLQQSPYSQKTDLTGGGPQIDGIFPVSGPIYKIKEEVIKSHW